MMIAMRGAPLGAAVGDGPGVIDSNGPGVSETAGVGEATAT